ncbi:hypothetical protein Taro_054075 [Colocasia esculenta]|uniref:RING-CH-type domain-containing protein n=1 Tax=Colocasia esculenta TaxID=4460 RepID=A0A843XMS7_COLES|nr:hypothetical protein [Colocasia esculenta]
MESSGAAPVPAAEVATGFDQQEVSNHDERHGQEIQPLSHSRRPNLSTLQIPARSLESPLPTSTRINTPSTSTPTSARAGLPPRPSSAKVKTSIRSMFPQRSFKSKNVTQECEKTGLLISGPPSSSESKEKPSTSQSSFFTRVFSSTSAKGTHSLPVTPIAGSGPDTMQGSHVVDLSSLRNQAVQKSISRSMSVPGNVKDGSLRRMDSLGGRIRVIPATPRAAVVDHSPTKDTMKEIGETEDDGEDIPEEEAVCRICFIELAEGGETLKMECSCKGELALAHKDCAVKWFSIKGNKTCDICKQDVQNLPVTLLRIQDPNVNRRQAAGIQQREMYRYSYIWAYASFQFAMVILFAHIFYTVLKVTAVLSVLLSSFTGFGIAICTSSLVAEFLRWRYRRTLDSALHQSNGNGQQEQSGDLETGTTETGGSVGQQGTGYQHQILPEVFVPWEW